MAIEFRTLAPGDEVALESAVPGVFDDPVDVRASEEFLADPRHHIAVALDAGHVVGFASAVHYVHPDKPHPEMWVNEVGVAPSHHRRGVAKGLLKLLFDVARRLECSEAWVLTDRSNLPAMRLYAGAGGEEAMSDQVMFTFRFSP